MEKNLISDEQTEITALSSTQHHMFDSGKVNTHTNANASTKFFAFPEYVGSHKFVGRSTELNQLNDFASTKCESSVFLLEAIGGSGKSMLTWHWLKNCALEPRDDWIGRFWYSFYNRGATLEDFCRQALSKISGYSLDRLNKLRTPALSEELLKRIRSEKWLIVLDGLERILAQYWRFDSASLTEEAVECMSINQFHLDPCSPIRDEDSDFLRRLVQSHPSKIVITSRLIPKTLLNSSGQPIPGIKHLSLKGLRSQDAEELFRSCRIHGNSVLIKKYLKKNCGNHPLVIGALAGLVRNYLPERGDFDAWAFDPGPKGGIRLNLTHLDLKQRQNHILEIAVSDLSKTSWKLLSALSLLSDAFDYEILEELNPHLPSDRPEPPTDDDIEILEELNPDLLSPPPMPPPPPSFEKPDITVINEELKHDDEIEKSQSSSTPLLDKLHLNSLKEKQEKVFAKESLHEKELNNWWQREDVILAREDLKLSILDLEHRGLLQYDEMSKHFDMHPVLRAVVASRIDKSLLESQGQKIINYLNSRERVPYTKAKTLEDVADAVQVVRTLIRMKRFEDAVDVLCNGLNDALLKNLEAYDIVLSLLHPFFKGKWGVMPDVKDKKYFILQGAGLAFWGLRKSQLAQEVQNSLIWYAIETKSAASLFLALYNFCMTLVDLGQVAAAIRVEQLCKDSNMSFMGNCLGCSLAEFFHPNFGPRNEMFAFRLWNSLYPISKNDSFYAMSVGPEALIEILKRINHKKISDKHFDEVENVVSDRSVMRILKRLRGRYYLEHGRANEAVLCFREALKLGRETVLPDSVSEAGLMLAKLRSGEHVDKGEVKCLSQQETRFHRYIAMLWWELGESSHAINEIQLAFTHAWGEGPPYADGDELRKTEILLRAWGVTVPKNLPKASNYISKPFNWEAAAKAFCEKERREKYRST